MIEHALTGYDWLIIGWGVVWEALIAAGLFLIHRAVTAESHHLAEIEEVPSVEPSAAKAPELPKAA